MPCLAQGLVIRNCFPRIPNAPNGNMVFLFSAHYLGLLPIEHLLLSRWAFCYSLLYHVFPGDQFISSLQLANLLLHDDQLVGYNGDQRSLG